MLPLGHIGGWLGAEGGSRFLVMDVERCYYTTAKYTSESEPGLGIPGEVGRKRRTTSPTSPMKKTLRC